MSPRRHPATEELVALALDPSAAPADAAEHVATCALCRGELEVLQEFFSERRAAARAEAEAAERDEGSRALVARVLAATTRQDLSLRGDLRLVRGFLSERLASSPALRVIAASLLLHLLLALPLSAFVLVRRAKPQLRLRVVEEATELPFAEDVPEPEWRGPLEDADGPGHAARDTERELEFLDPRRVAPDEAQAASERLRRRGRANLLARLPRGESAPDELGPVARELWSRAAAHVGEPGNDTEVAVDAVRGDVALQRLVDVLGAEAAIDRAMLDADAEAGAALRLAGLLRRLGSGPPINATLGRLEAATCARAEGAGLASAQVRARYFLLRSRIARRTEAKSRDPLLDPGRRAAEPLSDAWVEALRAALAEVGLAAEDESAVDEWLSAVEARLDSAPTPPGLDDDGR